MGGFSQSRNAQLSSRCYVFRCAHPQTFPRLLPSRDLPIGVFNSGWYWNRGQAQVGAAGLSRRGRLQFRGLTTAAWHAEADGGGLWSQLGQQAPGRALSWQLLQAGLSCAGHEGQRGGVGFS